MISLEEMLNCSVHLGHQVRKWNPKMSSFIYGERNGLHIIDVLQTLICLKKSTDFLYKSAKNNKSFLFVGTKRQFSSLVESCAISCNSYYVTKRWLGGTLTNWSTIKGCIDSLKILVKQELDGSFDLLTKKECLILKKRRLKLEKYFSGIKEMTKIPDIVIIIGQPREMNAVKECLKLNIKTVTIVDTNCDPTLTDFFIPANDDSVSSVGLILSELSKSIIKGKNNS
uniref:Small ribosomal subunit protein uS2c n=1 Tax=Phacus inflexus TaxID=461210 RepID=A0A3G3LKR3_9EUGL|nr:ribosomal protein S2 [Phacus inflexus]AYQ93302.1 ribosomal protein S2 [Phacus inflexus]